MKIRTSSTSLKVSYQYWLHQNETADQVILLLHGFGQRAEGLFKKLVPCMPPNAVVIAPNAPFPAPVKIGNAYKEAYAWYFYLAKEQRFVVPPVVAANTIKDLLCELSFQKLPLRMIGFSQGGYMAPALVRCLPQLEHVIAIGADYPSHYYEDIRSFRFDILHGVQDKIIPIDEVRSNYSNLKNMGVEAKLYEISDTGHEINSLVVEKIRELIS